MNAALEEKLLPKPNARFKSILQGLGVKADIPFFLDAPFLTGNRFLQMCIPSMEYKRSDAPPTLHFAGGLPKGHRDPFTNPPEWWPEVVSTGGKTVIAVAQGTVNLDFTELIVPTIEALGGDENILLVVALGARGASLPEGVAVPTNVRVGDFIPFDDLLPHCAALVCNAGYGTVLHAVACGTPMVLAGGSEDKPEMAARAENAGIAVNLRTGRPTPGQVRDAINEVLRNDTYKQRSIVLEAEVQSFDPIGIIEESIRDSLVAQ
ncbi:hypothetical protein NLG97_g1927 [Lecanicillium saksenae]|uniref:Uncharacterized protein n=1 Tax=Lecanicillium saksenae TaxID=468837 RepID=A0ACC1R2B2_9HYPO|nr:hypothetical protein NLG97_g1927 [Lecanicillium saksenae]